MCFQVQEFVIWAEELHTRLQRIIVGWWLFWAICAQLPFKPRFFISENKSQSKIVQILRKGRNFWNNLPRKKTLLQMIEQRGKFWINFLQILYISLFCADPSPQMSPEAFTTYLCVILYFWTWKQKKGGRNICIIPWRGMRQQKSSLLHPPVKQWSTGGSLLFFFIFYMCCLYAEN